jgi:molecular chaperone GrpE
VTQETERLDERKQDAAGAEVAPNDAEASITLGDLIAEIDQLRRERDEYLDSMQRSRAEFANYRRRQEQDLERLRQRASEDIVRKLLPVADDFDRALDAVPDDIARHPWIEGIRLVERKLWRVLEAEGVSVMDSVGQPFDPSRHEAVMVAEDAGAADTVVEEFQRGYLTHDAVLRPAMVKVGSRDGLVETQRDDES